jgi:hypothetical protein
LRLCWVVDGIPMTDEVGDADAGGSAYRRADVTEEGE